MPDKIKRMARELISSIPEFEKGYVIENTLDPSSEKEIKPFPEVKEVKMKILK